LRPEKWRRVINGAVCVRHPGDYITDIITIAEETSLSSAAATTAPVMGTM